MLREEIILDEEPLIFDINIVQGKPNSYRKTNRALICPFCQTNELTDIYEKEGDMIWLHNKFPTLRDTVQTVLIESGNHVGDITTYTPKYNRDLMRFALKCFKQMNKQKLFKSVLWYKNYGPHSGGSLSHPHMQIVGLKKQDGYRYICEKNFIGITVFNGKDIEVNISTYPVQGYIEFNFNLLKISGLERWSDWIQSGTKYLLNVLSGGRCDSYNLFFYPREDQKICAKLIARFAAPPYFIGYKLSQVDNKEKLVEEATSFKHFFNHGSRLD